MYLALDGSATVYVNASVPALVALRGARSRRRSARPARSRRGPRVLRVAGHRRRQRDDVTARQPPLRAPAASRSSDMRRLGEARAVRVVALRARRATGEVAVFRQTVGASAGRDVGDVGWTGDELVAFRLHLPSRVPFHNSPSREIERGNIIVGSSPGRSHQGRSRRHRSAHGTGIDPGPDADAVCASRSLLALATFGAGDLVGDAAEGSKCAAARLERRSE